MTEPDRRPLSPHDLELIHASWRAANYLSVGPSRALIVADPTLRGELTRRGILTRDPGVKGLKKAGLTEARKRPQFSEC